MGPQTDRERWKKASKKYYAEHKAHPGFSDKQTTLYKCPLCNFNITKLEQFEARELKMMVRLYGGRGVIKVNEVAITPQYKEKIKEVLKELLEQLD